VEKCYFCSATLPTEQAVEAGWIPYFWDGDTDREITHPVCSDCQQKEGIIADQYGECERPALEPVVVMV